MSHYENSTNRSNFQIDIMMSIMRVQECVFLQITLEVKKLKTVKLEKKLKNFRKNTKFQKKLKSSNTSPKIVQQLIFWTGISFEFQGLKLFFIPPLIT